MQRPAIQIFFSRCPWMQHYGGGVSVRSQGEGLSVPPPGPHPRTFPVRIRRWKRPQRNLVFPSVLRRVEAGPSVSQAGASRALSAVERDGAAASALDRWIGRDVPAHLHPTRDRRGAAEASLPGRRGGGGKYFNGFVVQNKGSSSTVMSAPCQDIFDFFFFFCFCSLFPNENPWRHQSTWGPAV